VPYPEGTLFAKRLHLQLTSTYQSAFIIPHATASNDPSSASRTRGLSSSHEAALSSTHPAMEAPFARALATLVAPGVSGAARAEAEQLVTAALEASPV